MKGTENKINTQIIKLCGDEYKDEDKIKRAAQLLKSGGLAVFPTETVYGLGANALDVSAVYKIYKAKGRPSDNPLIVHLADVREIEKYAVVTETAQKVIDCFMPAPLTVVLKKKDIISSAVTAGLDTVAIRVPKDKTARRMIELAGVPVAAPSANLSGKPSPTSANHAVTDMDGRVDAILCGCDCEIGLESTVIAFDDCDNINILRSGYITKEMLENAIRNNRAVVNVSQMRDAEIPKSPGMKYAHYMPDAPFYILSGNIDKIIAFIKEKATENTQKVGFLCYNEISEKFGNCGNNIDNLKVMALGSMNNLEEQSKNFFAALHKFNETGVDIIYSLETERVGVGEALYNRMIKSAGGKIIYV